MMLVEYIFFVLIHAFSFYTLCEGTEQTVWSIDHDSQCLFLTIGVAIIGSQILPLISCYLSYAYLHLRHFKLFPYILYYRFLLVITRPVI